MFKRAHVLLTSICLLASTSMAEEGSRVFGPAAGEKIPPLESIIDENTKSVCRHNMGVD